MSDFAVLRADSGQVRKGSQWPQPTKQGMTQGSFVPPGDAGLKILLVAGTHGFPPSRTRLERVRELAGQLALRQALVHVVLLAEKRVSGLDEQKVEQVRPWCHDLRIVEHPSEHSGFHRALHSAGEFIGEKLMRRPANTVRWQHCPQKLLRILHSEYAPRNYLAVIAIGAPMALALREFSRWTSKIVDLPRVASACHSSHASHGRGDVFKPFADATSELQLLDEADFCVVACQKDAAVLRSEGFLRDAVLVPPTGSGAVLSAVTSSRPPAETPRPPRILCVATESVADLDGLRWFRRDVFPRIQRAVPTCRLRIVGEGARHIDPDDSVDRVGWATSLHDEYGRAAVVALPLRMGGGLRRRAVEALSHGKTLVTTPTGAWGIALRPMTDAVVADEPSQLATEAARVLTSDDLRRQYELHALALARRDFHPTRAMAPLCSLLGLPILPVETADRQPVPV